MLVATKQSAAKEFQESVYEKSQNGTIAVERTKFAPQLQWSKPLYKFFLTQVKIWTTDIMVVDSVEQQILALENDS